MEERIIKDINALLAQLFQKIHEAGYEWDAEKKGLKKIEPFDKYEGLTDFERTLTDICIGWIGEELGWKQYIKDNADVLLQIAIKKFHSVQDAPFEQKHAEWSEDDKWMIKDICSAFEKGSSQYIWLKSLKDRVLPQPKQEWNKEDEDILITIINHFEIDLECTENDDIIRWLKTISHKLQNKYRTEKPVFKIGDVLTDKDKQVTSKVIDIVNDMYVCDNCSFPVYQQDEYELADKGEMSDGYHTFNELYYYRMLYNAAFFNLLPSDIVHKSKRHHDGEECFGGGWFIVMANLPTGQISNHYELKDWDLFKIPEKEVADEWDGHTPKQAAERLHRYLLRIWCL